MPQNERIRVWKGELQKTSGGLRKVDLIKNKRGKIVSKSKSEAAKKNDGNNLGAWLRSKGDHFLSKGLKQENIVRKGKPGRKAFQKKKEEKQAVVKKMQSGSSASKSAVKQAPPIAKKKPGPPKITRTEPSKPGDKPKNKTNIDVGNISTRPKRKRKKRVLHNVGKF